VDADCVVANSFPVRCHDDCGGAIALASTGTSAVESSVNDANHRYCQPFEEQGCRVELLPCVAPLPDGTPVCESGICQSIEASTPAGATTTDG
jgi:hypothetical protein